MEKNKYTGVIEYRFKSNGATKEVVKTVRYKNLFQYIVAAIRVSILSPDTIINHKATH